MAVLSLKNVGYTYEKTSKPVFQGLNAEFEPGRLYCIVGKIRSGKDIPALLLAGLDICTEEPSCMRVRICVIWTGIGTGPKNRRYIPEL